MIRQLPVQQGMNMMEEVLQLDGATPHRIVRDAVCVTNEMLVNTWQETENHLDVRFATNSIHIEIY
jgi:hypothetical protein